MVDGRGSNAEGMLVRMGRLVRSLASVAIVAAALLGVGCGGGGSVKGAGSADVTSVTDAAYVSDLAPGYQFDLSLTAGTAGHSFAITGTGAIDDHAKRGQISMTVKGVTVSEVIASPYIYVEVPSTASSTGPRWVKANLNAYSQAVGGGDPLGGSSANPSQLLGFLKAAGAVSVVGSEDVRGTSTTHYHATIDLARYATVLAASEGAKAKRYAELLERMTGGATMPMDVWIDSAKRVRRIAFTLNVCTPEGRLTESMSMDLYGYGHQIPVASPPPGNVPDITAQMTSGLASVLPKLSCH